MKIFVKQNTDFLKFGHLKFCEHGEDGGAGSLGFLATLGGGSLGGGGGRGRLRFGSRSWSCCRRFLLLFFYLLLLLLFLIRLFTQHNKL